jgi:hypothetical protein
MVGRTKLIVTSMPSLRLFWRVPLLNTLKYLKHLENLMGICKLAGYFESNPHASNPPLP